MRRLLAVLLVTIAFDASACGICIDDKVASCYDYAVVTGAKAKGHAVVLKAIEALPGVLRGTGRVSLENAALSFAFDPARISAEAVQRELRAKLQPGRLGVAHLRTL
jgi:hypothetical protein